MGEMCVCVCVCVCVTPTNALPLAELYERNFEPPEVYIPAPLGGVPEHRIGLLGAHEERGHR